MAYAALLSLSQLLQQTLDRNHQYLILDEKQKIESLLQSISSLKEVLDCSAREITGLWGRQIRDAAYITEDIVESRITDRIESESAIYDQTSVIRFDVIDKIIGYSSEPASSGRADRRILVGLDDFKEIKARLLTGSDELEIVSVVGTCGIGKTTIAKQVFNDSLVVSRFKTRFWATLPEGVRDIANRFQDSQASLIVLDNVWDAKVWDHLKCSFPINNWSRIMVITRDEHVASNADSSPHHMRFLNDSNSWILFCEKVFGGNCCPPILEEIGKKIVQHCRGLPLAIVVVGGLLAKNIKTQHFWKYVEENVSSFTTCDNEHYLKILSFCHRHLPYYLRRCYLYMGMFPEDYSIHVPKLVKLWISEGILYPVKSKSLEEVAEECFLDLVDRNLIMVQDKRWDGKIKMCRIHELLQVLCMREAQKEKFFHVISRRVYGIQQGTSMHRVSIHRNTSTRDNEMPMVLQSLINFDPEFDITEMSNTKLLKVLHHEGKLEFSHEIADWVNLRYLECESIHPWPSISKLENLQTIIIRPNVQPLYLALDIWKMPQLRHVLLKYVILPHPSSARAKKDKSTLVLENLQTLSLVENFRCTKEVIGRIPNIRKLGINYKNTADVPEDYCLRNLFCLSQLESLKFIFSDWRFQDFSSTIFPLALKELTLSGYGRAYEYDFPMTWPWRVGSFPNLQVLKLKSISFKGYEWETKAEEFLQLKFLLLENVFLQNWIVDDSSFPRLQRLVLKNCHTLNQIPDEFGTIPTLESIELHGCGHSAKQSIRRIQEKQRRQGNDVLEVLIVSNDPRHHF